MSNSISIAHPPRELLVPLILNRVDPKTREICQCVSRLFRSMLIDPPISLKRLKQNAKLWMQCELISKPSTKYHEFLFRISICAIPSVGCLYQDLLFRGALYSAAGFEELEQFSSRIASHCYHTPHLSQITPKYVHQYMHPGMRLNEKGTFGFVIENFSMITSGDLERASESFPQAMLKEIRKSCPFDDDSRGCMVAPDPTMHFLVGISPVKMKNHQNAISDLRSWIGKIGHFSDQTIIDHLLKSHASLFKAKACGGVLRSKNLVVFPDQGEDQRSSNWTSLLISHGGSRGEVATLKQMLQEAEKCPGGPEERLGQMTENERKVMSKFCFVPPLFQEIPQQMRNFAQKLRESILEMERTGNKDPIDLAAFAHQRLIEIHPFVDGNGRLARGLMNAILMEYGIQAVIFPSDEEYTAAVEKNKLQPGYFSKYLRTVAIPRMKKIPQFLD